MKWESLTRAAKEGEEVGVLEADVEGELALGGVHQRGVGQAHLDIKDVRKRW